MSKTAYINIRVEKKLKADAQKVLASIGLSMSDAITIFLRQIVLQQGLPFKVRMRKTREEMLKQPPNRIY